jgi:hypothetical protein
MWDKYPEEWEAISGLIINPYQDADRESTFGFNLSRTKGLVLQNLIEKGKKVVVRAIVNAEIIPDGIYEIPTAIIPGTDYPDEEFIFYAHLDHPKPGSHDNASGSAAILEIARTLSSLIQNNIIPPPKRSIRFMWVPHMRGFHMYFYHHPEKIGKIIGGCNLDCIGADPAKFPLKFYVSLPPPSLPSILTDITNNCVETLNKMIDDGKNYLFSPEGSRNLFSATIRPYRGASDEELISTWPVSIPSIYFYDSPLPPRHSQINFLEYMDRTNLRRISYLGAIIAYAFTTAGDEMIPSLLNEIQFRGEQRIAHEMAKAKALLWRSRADNIHMNFQETQKLLQWGFQRERDFADSVKSFTNNKKQSDYLISDYKDFLKQRENSVMKQLHHYYKNVCKKIGIKPRSSFPQKPQFSWEGKIPVRSPEMKAFPGCFRNWQYFRDVIGKDFLDRYEGLHSAFYRRNNALQESFNFIDGQRTLGEIYNMVKAGVWSAGYSNLPYYLISPEVFWSYFRLLTDAKIISYQE